MAVKAPLSTVPEKLLVFLRPEEKKDWKIAGDLSVFPAYAVDSENLERQMSAKKWSEGHYYSPTKKGPIPEPVLVDNHFTLRILDLEIRGEGGRAYKVVDQHGYSFDFRERALLDCFKHAGVKPGGYLDGEYLFIRDASQMVLVRKGSDLEKAARSEQKKALEPVKAKDLVPGKAYRELRSPKYSQQYHIYLGTVKFPEGNREVWAWTYDEKQVHGFLEIPKTHRKIYELDKDLFILGKDEKVIQPKFVTQMVKEHSEYYRQNKQYFANRSARQDFSRSGVPFKGDNFLEWLQNEITVPDVKVDQYHGRALPDNKWIPNRYRQSLEIAQFWGLEDFFWAQVKRLP